MSSVHLVFPHQLFHSFKDIYLDNYPVYLVEEYLYFNQYKFHKQKIAFHRASMKNYEQLLLNKGYNVIYIDAQQEDSDIRKLISQLSAKGVNEIRYTDTVDFYLNKRIKSTADSKNITLDSQSSPNFINDENEVLSYFKGKKKYLQANFYKKERIRFNILVDNKNEPTGGKWSYDDENRKKYPKNKEAPEILFPYDDFYAEASEYVSLHYNDNPGMLSKDVTYPITRQTALEWLTTFFKSRFEEFGPYEDAIVSNETFLNHSVLTPILNVGLVSPLEVVKKAIDISKSSSIPLNSTEGFIRQIIGWREFIRGVYLVKGVEQRTTNFWGFKRKIPTSFYTGTTGIVPVDDTINKVLKTGYCHHIERLMILGNFMLLCEFDPDEVYRWFMELFIDAYDWVMVPNVYGMSQFADGGLFATKPYISGSNYVIKMSNYKKGEWSKVWDALFWRFMDVNRNFFLKNHRLGMLVRSYDKMSAEKQNGYHIISDEFLNGLKDS